MAEKEALLAEKEALLVEKESLLAGKEGLLAAERGSILPFPPCVFCEGCYWEVWNECGELLEGLTTAEEPSICRTSHFPVN